MARCSRGYVAGVYMVVPGVVDVNMGELRMPALSPRTTYHHGHLREALIAAGLEVLDAEGLAGPSLREVARRCGVSHAAPLRHFADHRAMMTALAAAAAHHLRDHLRVVRQAQDPACVPLREAGVAYVAYARHWPQRFRLMWRSDLIHPEDAAYRAAMGGLWHEVMGGMEHLAGEVPTAVLMPRLLLAMAAVHGLATLLIEDGFPALGAPFAGGHEDTRAVLDLLGPVFASPRPGDGGR